MACYYRGTFYGKSSSAVLYELSKQLNKVSRDMLWWRIVGITDRIINNKVNEEDKNGEQVECQEEVSRLVPEHANNNFAAVNEMENGLNQENEHDDLFRNVVTKNENKEQGHIKSELELNLMLLRHWTLFDSLQNSSYVFTKLELWNEPGQEQLRRFVATMGCPLVEAKQKYQFMDPKVKANLKENFYNKCDRFALDELIQHTYVR